MAFLSSNDLPLSLALRLYQRYGGEALDAVRENPYLLVDELYGVDFAVMDEIALSMGMAGDSRRRVEAAVLFELTYNLNNGHVFLRFFFIVTNGYMQHKITSQGILYYILIAGSIGSREVYKIARNWSANSFKGGQKPHFVPCPPLLAI